ncbi:MAG: hypothetical protein LIO85_03910 [Rikenellaceae bacterium]|nr:hypothetical protein [Rikenellaceae bacterium]
MATDPHPGNPFFGTFFVVGLDIFDGRGRWHPSPSLRPGSRAWRFAPDDQWPDREGNLIYIGSVFNYLGGGPDDDYPFCYDTGSGLLGIDMVPDTDECWEEIETHVYEVGNSGGDILLTAVPEEWPVGGGCRWRLRKM